MIKDRLGANAVPLQLPIGLEDKFEGVIDLIAMEEIVYLDDKGEKSERRPIRAELKADADKWHAFMLDQAAGQTDALT